VLGISALRGVLMSILKPYKVNSYRRLCDICGRPRQIEDIRFSDNVAICSIHPQYRTAQQLNRINARERPIRILPVPQPKPLAPVDTWTAEEAQLLNFITATTPFETVDVTSNAGARIGKGHYQSLGWSLVYLAGLVIENKRPGPWLALARAKTKVLADLCLTLQTQYSAALGNGALAGGFDLVALNSSGDSAYLSQDTGIILAGYCQAYAALGDDRYLQAAKSAAGFLVAQQATSLSQFDPHPDVGPPVHSLNSNDGVFIRTYYPGDLVCLWGMSLLKGIAGDISVGPLASAFTADPARLISTWITRTRAFWTDGIGGINGFSAATPFSYYDAPTASWTGTTISTVDWATAVFALAETEGVSTQVGAIWDYLRTITGPTGYDATLAPPTAFASGAATTALYDWASAGLLARVTSARARASLKTIKDTLSVPRQRYNEATPRSGETLYLGPLGVSSFAFAPISENGKRLRSVARASQTSFLYRQQPQGFTGRGH
jgi:hypothetical protein